MHDGGRNESMRRNFDQMRFALVINNCKDRILLSVAPWILRETRLQRPIYLITLNLDEDKSIEIKRLEMTRKLKAIHHIFDLWICVARPSRRKSCGHVYYNQTH